MIKKGIRLLMCFVLAAAVIVVGPKALQRFWGDDHARWVSERFSETLREKNELVVYEVEITGQETVTQDAWLIGTVQKIVIPYTFCMRFTVDLSRAAVSAKDDGVILMIPSPEGKYPQLIIDEEKVQKIDWLYPLTTERYGEIKQQLEAKLLSEFSSNEEYQTNAWNIALSNLTGLFDQIAEQGFPGFECDIEIMKIESDIERPA